MNEKNVVKVNILDPIFTLKNFKEVLRYLVEIEFRPIISFQMKFEIFYKQISNDIELLNLFKLLNVELEFGLQSINRKVLANVERTNDIKIIEEVINTLNLNSIDYEVSIIRGLPGETVESFKELMKFIEHVKCKKYVVYQLTLLSNTKLFNDKEILEIESFTQNGLEYVIES